MELGAFERLIAPILNEVRGAIRKAILGRVDDSTGVQTVQMSRTKGDDADLVEHLQPYGMSFRPPEGSEGVALEIGGDANHLVLLCVAPRKERPRDVAAGEGGLWHHKHGWRVFLDDAGDVHLAAQTGASKLARADRVDAEIQRIWDVLTGWTPVLHDGGLALKGTATTASAGKQSTAADKVHGT